jgi:hypothetical protein
VGPLAPAFGWWDDMWVLMLIFGDLLLGKAVCSVWWALFVSVTLDVIFYAFLSRLLCVFFLFRTRIPEMAYYPKQLWN